MSNAIILFLMGLAVGNDKTRTQLSEGINQLTGQGIDFLNNMSGKQNQGDEDDKSE